MNKSMLVGTILGIAVATTGGVVAGYKLLQSDEPQEQSLAVIEHGTVSELCDPTATEPRDKHRIAGTAIGAVVGGAVGNDIGDSDVTTAAGAAAGAFAGHEIQKRLQENEANRAANDCVPSSN